MPKEIKHTFTKFEGHGLINKLMTVFYTVCPVIDHEFRHNIVAECIRRLLWQYYEEIHCQLQDRRITNWHQLALYNNKLSNCPLLLAGVSHEFQFQIHVYVRILTIKDSQSACMNFWNYCNMARICVSWCLSQWKLLNCIIQWSTCSFK